MTWQSEGWELESAEARHERYPGSFWIPSAAERETLKIGNLAKLLFVLPEATADGLVPRVERMWVVVAASAPHRYEGLLASIPTSIETPLQLGSPVAFGPEHVCDIESDERGLALLDELRRGGGDP